MNVREQQQQAFDVAWKGLKARGWTWLRWEAYEKLSPIPCRTEEGACPLEMLNDADIVWVAIPSTSGHFGNDIYRAYCGPYDTGSYTMEGMEARYRALAATYGLSIPDEPHPAFAAFKQRLLALPAPKEVELV